jgi:hypothetical protein
MDMKVAQNPETARAVEEYLVNVGKDMQRAESAPLVMDILGSTYCYHDGRLEMIHHIDEEQPDCIRVFSLNGLVDLIRADVDNMFAAGSPTHIVRVTGESRVEVISPAIGHRKSRYRRIECFAPTPNISFGKYRATEDFQVMMQTCFEESDARNVVMKIAGSASKEQSMRKSDDGMAQTIQVKTGVVTVGDVTIKNPVPLTPLRTFYEVEQVTSPFILRFDENANAALYEGDGGAWKLQAVTRVADWLREKLSDCNVCVIG